MKFNKLLQVIIQMKKFLLIIAFFSAAQTGYSQNIFSLFSKANNFFDLFIAGKFDTAHSYFSEEGKTKVTSENLKQFWTNIESQLGKVKTIDANGSKNQGEFYAVTVNGEFEKGKQNFVLTFNKDEKVVGLFMPPNSAAYKLPPYADSTTYTETYTYVGQKERQLAAVVTTPKNATKFPMVVFVHGSGPSDMDETIGPNKPFKDIAAGLASNGIGSIRYVKRTLIYAKDFDSTFTTKEEVSDDALSAIALAKTVQGADTKSFYVFGHSLGGMLAPRLATLVPDLKGIVIAAAPARKLTDIIIDQNKYLVELSKDTTALMQQNLKNAITEIEKSRFTTLGSIKPDSLVLGLPATYWIDLNNYDQLETAKNLKQRLYILQGGNDFQVAEIDFNLWKTALDNKSNATLKLYPMLNHLLSAQMEKGTVAQYQIFANVDQQLVDDLSNWINIK